MDILGAKGAAKEAHQAVDDALDKVRDQIIPGVQDAARNIEDHGVYGLYALVADVANRLHGAECPVDITVELKATVRVTGKIGALRLTRMEYDAGIQK